MERKQSLAKARLSFFSFALSTLTPGLADAQTASAPPPKPAETSDQPSADSGSALGDIVVTAQKRNERLQDVGITVQAFSGATLKAQGVDNLVDLPRISSGVNITGSYAGQNLSFAIRGVQQQDFAAIAEGPNAVYIDEGYIGISNDSAIGLFDIDSVQILKGPQGTLFGRNATGGVVNILTRDPSQRSNGYVDLTYGSRNTRRVEGAFGGPLGTNVSGRIAFLYNANDNWIKNLSPAGGDLGRNSEWGVRGKLRFQPSASSDVLATAFATRTVSSWGPYFRANVIPTFTAAGAVVNAALTNADTGFGPGSNIDDLALTSHDAQSRGDFQEMQGANLKVTYNAAGWTFSSIADFKHFRNSLNLDDIVAPVFLIDTHDRDYFKSWSEELRAFKSWGSVRSTSGLYYLHMDNNLYDDQDYRGIGLNDVVSNAHLLTTAYAVFAQAEWDFAPKWTVIAGIRYTDDTKHYRYQAVDPYAGVTVRDYPAAGGEARLHDGLVTDKFEVEYKPRQYVLLYVSYNRGAKAGSFNSPQHAATPPADPQIAYRPEIIDAYEAGFKLDAWNGRARLNAAGYYYDYRNAQTYVFLLPLNSEIINADERTVGGEVEATVEPTRGLTLNATLAYTDARVLNVAINGNPPGDRRVPLTPKIHTTFFGRYEWPFATGKIGIEANAQFQSSSFLGLANYDADRIDPYWLVGGRVSWQDDGGKWSAALSAENLLDQRYKTVGFDVASLGILQYAVGRPRWIKASLSRRF